MPVSVCLFVCPFPQRVGSRGSRDRAWGVVLGLGGEVQGATKRHLCLSVCTYVSMFVSSSPQWWGSGSGRKVGGQGVRGPWEGWGSKGLGVQGGRFTGVESDQRRRRSSRVGERVGGMGVVGNGGDRMIDYVFLL